MYAYVHYLGNTGYVLLICMKEELYLMAQVVLGVESKKDNSWSEASH
jgi:hypothetical protein